MTNHSLTNQGPLNQLYLKRIEETLHGALLIHPRLTVIRVDLRLPDNGCYSDNFLERDTPTFFFNSENNLIKPFIASLSSQIQEDAYIKLKTGRRVHPCNCDYIWAREFSQRHKQHYHIALMLNKDAFHSLGHYCKKGSLAMMIMQAWSNALHMHFDQAASLVHFPDNPVYLLNYKQPHDIFKRNLYPVLTRLSYLAKEKTKIYGTGQRNFGCSNPKKRGA